MHCISKHPSTPKCLTAKFRIAENQGEHWGTKFCPAPKSALATVTLSTNGGAHAQGTRKARVGPLTHLPGLAATLTSSLSPSSPYPQRMGK